MSRVYFEGLISKNTLIVLSVFLEHPDELYHINQIAKLTGIPVASAFRIIMSLLDNGLIQYKLIGKLKIYSLSKNKKTTFLKKVLR